MLTVSDDQDNIVLWTRMLTSGMLWTAMASAITGPMFVNDEKATCKQAERDVYVLQLHSSEAHTLSLAPRTAK